MPWYSTHGNHDGTVVGYFRALAPQLALYWDQIATGNVPDFGSVMFLDLPTGMSIDTFEDCLGFPTPTCVTSIYENRVTREVPANEDRDDLIIFSDTYEEHVRRLKNSFSRDCRKMA